MAFDYRKFLHDPDPEDIEPTPAQQAEFRTIVGDIVDRLRRSNRSEVNVAINKLLSDPATKTRVGSQLIQQIPEEIKRRLDAA